MPTVNTPETAVTVKTLVAVDPVKITAAGAAYPSIMPYCPSAIVFPVTVQRFGKTPELG
jgi:hypothetical protein